jgi:hypothetical protein
MDTNGRAEAIEKRRGATHAEINRGDDRAVARESGRCLDHIVGHNENVVRLEVSVDHSLQRTQPRAFRRALKGRCYPCRVAINGALPRMPYPQRKARLGVRPKWKRSRSVLRTLDCKW